MLRTLLLSLAAFLLSGTAFAASRPLGNIVEMDLIDRDNGVWLPQYSHRGDRWVAGVPGHRYGVRLTNTSDRRVLVVLSVDGINAVTGETAQPLQSGYVLEPWATAEITGWRKSLNDVSQFEFTDIGDSYAVRTGRARNVGVVGIAVFQEQARPILMRPTPPIFRPRPYAENARAAERAAAAQADSAYSAEMRRDTQSIGTGHGQREWAPVGETTFRRASKTPAQISEIRYDQQRRLVARGVIPRETPRYPDTYAPRAFSGDFVPDPPRGR